VLDVRAYVLVIVVALNLICSCLHCLPGEKEEHIDHREDTDENDDTDVEEREGDQAEANRTCVDEQLGPDLEFAGRLLPSERERFVNHLAHADTSPEFASMAKSLNEHPPEVGDLVHIYHDDALPPYPLYFGKLTKYPNALMAVPLGIVTQPSRPFEEQYDNECDRPAHDPAINCVAVRRLQDGDLGRNSLLFEDIRVIPIGLVPKRCGDVINEWPTPSGSRTMPTGLRKMTFGVPFADSAVFLEYGEGNLFLTAKSAPGQSVRQNNRIPADDFAKSVWSFEAGMLFRLDDALLKLNFSDKGMAFAKEANPKDGSGNLMLLALRTFKYDLATGEQCSYLADDNALAVVMAYVTTVSDVRAYALCRQKGLEIAGPDGPIVYEIPFRKLSFPGDYQFLGGHPDRDIYPKEMVHDVLKRLVESKTCGAPASLDLALNQGSPLPPFGGKTPIQDILRFNPEVSALCSRSFAT